MLLLASLSSARCAVADWTTQLASLSNERAASERVAELRAGGVEAYLIRSNVPGAGLRFRVRVGRFPTREAAQRQGERLRGQGLAKQFLVAEYEAPPGVPIADPPRGGAEPASVTPAPAPAVAAAAGSAEDPMAKVAPGPAGADFVAFEDKAVGYSFRYPRNWTGAAWTDEKRLANVSRGASFRSLDERAFLNAIWNEVPAADDPGRSNDTVLVDSVLKGMAAGPDVAELWSGPHRVENEAGQTKTYVDVWARFRRRGDATAEPFWGKAAISRVPRGVLLVVVFYSQDSPPSEAANAERIVRSVRAPDGSRGLPPSRTP